LLAMILSRKKTGITQLLLFTGTETATVTSGVFLVITAGVTVIVESRVEIELSTTRALARQSSAVAPGTMPRRAPSYTAFSTLCRIMFTRLNSKDAKKNKNRIGAQIANSTTTAPTRVAARQRVVRLEIMVL